MFVPPLLSRCSLQLKRQRLKYLKSWWWLWVALPGVRVFLATLLVPSIGCSARFCSAACFANHKASCPFVSFAKPVMITFHESLKGASIGWAVAQQSVPVLFNPCSVMFQRSFSATGCFTAGSLHPLARSPTVDCWASLHPWFACGAWPQTCPSARCRPRPLWAGIALPTGVVGWLFLARSSSKACQVLGFTRASESSEVEDCVPIACPWLVLLRFHFGPVCLVAQLSRAPPCSVQPSLWPGFSFRSGTFTRLLPVRDHAHGHFKNVCGVASCCQTSVAATTFALGLVVNFPVGRVHTLSSAS